MEVDRDRVADEPVVGDGSLDLWRFGPSQLDVGSAEGDDQRGDDSVQRPRPVLDTHEDAHDDDTHDRVTASS